MLQKDVDTKRLMDLVSYVENESKSFETDKFTSIIDYSSSFAFASSYNNINAYKEAISSLNLYLKDGKNEHLENFYAQREIALNIMLIFHMILILFSNEAIRMLQSSWQDVMFITGNSC